MLNFLKRPTIGTAIGANFNIDSEVAKSVIDYMSRVGNLLELNESVGISIALNFKEGMNFKKLVPTDKAKYKTEMRFTIDGKDYDMTFKEFKKRITQ